MRIKPEDLEKHCGQKVWVADLRAGQHGPMKRLIRSIPPQQVVVRPESEAKKTVYYSEYFFRGLRKDGRESSKEIMVYDNTGYRAYKGVALGIFTTESEAREYFNQQKGEILSRLEENRKNAVRLIDERIEEIKSYK